MGHMYRFVEPVVLYALKLKGESHGYDLAGVVQECALMDAEIERASLYRTLKQLEAHGHVTSRWRPTRAARPAASTGSPPAASSTCGTGWTCWKGSRSPWRALWPTRGT